jgi:OCT family organic cation transporter-like MFS transporter 4/5
MGLLGLFFGAFIAGIYTDKFGRKNAIHVWNGICMLCLIAHSFMPDKYGFLIFRAIGNGANVSTFVYFSFPFLL